MATRNYTPIFSEIIEDFEKAPTRKEKIEILREYDNPRFREFLMFAFNPKIEFDVKVPKYKESFDPAGLAVLTIAGEMPRLYRFVKDHPKNAANLSEQKKENLLAAILESLEKGEAKLLAGMIEKKLEVKYLTPLLVKEAYPGIDI